MQVYGIPITSSIVVCTEFLCKTFLVSLSSRDFFFATITLTFDMQFLVQANYNYLQLTPNYRWPTITQPQVQAFIEISTPTYSRNNEYGLLCNNKFMFQNLHSKSISDTTLFHQKLFYEFQHTIRLRTIQHNSFLKFIAHKMKQCKIRYK